MLLVSLAGHISMDSQQKVLRQRSLPILRFNPAKIRARPATTMSMGISTITSLSRKMNQPISSLLLAAKGVSQTASE